MKCRIFFLVSLFLAFAAGPAWAVDCAKCHKPWLEKANAKVVKHSPFADADCESCHADHGGTNKLVLTEEGTELCFQCHDAFKGTLHSLIKDEGCLSCHDPHASGEKKLLTQSLDTLCQECHDDVGKGTVVHAALTDGSCTDCHSPHASPNKNLLLKKGTALCLDCHDIPKEGAQAHTAVTDGDCKDCHESHAGKLPRLLKKTYLTDRYPGPFSEDKYALCFDCHEVSVFTAEKTTETGFRQGDFNLHNIHVLGEIKANKYGIKMRGKSRSCALCHDPHGTEQAFLLITKYDCGEVFCFTMRFIPKDDGGRCFVGCHKPQTYSRSGKVVEEVASGPEEAPKPAKP